MKRIEFHRVSQIALGLLTLGLIALLVAGILHSSRVRKLTLAAGSPDGESYIICSALKTVVERHYPKIRIRIIETAGTVENLGLLERSQADLATAQADVPPGPSARSVAVLYDDVFQLLVYQGSTIRNFPGVRGKVVALARGGGQFDSFLRVAEHFGLQEADFTFVGVSDASADEAFSQRRADALFRVRAIGNPSIQHLVEAGNVRFVGIGHSAAMKIRHPAFQPAVIPIGAYVGEPPMPSEDLPTVAVHRTLLARQDSDEVAVRTVVSVLIERRLEIMQEIPAGMSAVRLLLSQVHRPDARAELGPAVHPGAASFYDQDKPSFLLAHADYVGLMLSVILMAASWFGQLKGWVERQKKDNADEYSNRVMELLTAAQATDSLVTLDAIRSELLSVLTAAVRDLDADKLSEDTFQSFRAILQIALEVAKERRDVLAPGRVAVPRLIGAGADASDRI
jgi:TRAP transporter TAXI family solute receptor